MQPRTSFLTCSREELLALCAKGQAGIRHPIPAELRRRPRGCKAGAGLKAKLAKNRRRYKPSIPSIIMGNVNSLPNKIDELSALNNQRIYHESSLFIFMETLLNHLVPDANVDLLGFTATRDDKDTKASGKSKGGGLIMYVNNRWCNPGHISIKTSSCALRDCYNTTVWDVLINPHGEDIEGMTHRLTGYQNFYADVVSPVKTVRCYHKPWVTRGVKTVLNKKKAAFRSRDREAMKAAQQEVKHCVREAKDSYRRKVEQKLRENNMREVWEGVRTITGHNTKTSATGWTMERANELNDFNRFNQPFPPPPPPSLQPSLLFPSTHPPPPPPPQHHHITSHHDRPGQRTAEEALAQESSRPG